MMNFFERRAKLKNVNYLTLTPIRLESETVDENNIVTVLIPRFKSKFAQKHIVPKLKSIHIKLKLDVVGSAVWLLIDGTKKVSEMVPELVNKFNDTDESMEKRLTKFLSLLYDNRLITFKEITSLN